MEFQFLQKASKPSHRNFLKKKFCSFLQKTNNISNFGLEFKLQI